MSCDKVHVVSDHAPPPLSEC